MAKVILKEKRELEAGYHIYRQPSEAGDLITVRRKVAMPSDVEHNSSKPTQRHRQTLARASKRWASIPAPIKAIMSDNYGFVPIKGHFAQADYKVLKGRELFIAQEIHKLEYQDAHQETPLWLCVQAVDPTGRIIDIPLKLRNSACPGCNPCLARQIAIGNTLFWPACDVEYYYAVDYTIFGIHGQQSHTYYYDELKKGVQQTWYPKIFENGAGPYSTPTNPSKENWHFTPAETPQNLCICTVHEHNGLGWDMFFTDPMAHFIVDKINSSQVKVRIAPLAFHWDNVFGDNIGGTFNHYWDIHVTGPGEWTVEPNKYTMIYDYVKHETVRYEF